MDELDRVESLYDYNHNGKLEVWEREEYQKKIFTGKDSTEEWWDKITGKSNNQDLNDNSYYEWAKERQEQIHEFNEKMIAQHHVENFSNENICNNSKYNSTTDSSCYSNPSEFENRLHRIWEGINIIGLGIVLTILNPLMGVIFLIIAIVCIFSKD